jgi:hypothetical protein
MVVPAHINHPGRAFKFTANILADSTGVPMIINASVPTALYGLT